MQSAPLRREHSAYRPVMQAAYSVGMAYDSPRHVRRRENLRRLLEENGGAAQVAREVGTPKSHFSAILASRRGLGDDLAKKLEDAYGKTPGWFDKEARSDWPFSPELHEKVLLLSEDARRRLEPVVLAAIDMQQQSSSPITNTRQLSSAQRAAPMHDGTLEESTGLPPHLEGPGPKEHGSRQKDRRSAPAKRRRDA